MPNLGCVRKQAEKDHGEEARKQPSIIASASVPALTSFSDGSLGSKIKPFFPKMLLAVVFYYNNNNRSMAFVSMMTLVQSQEPTFKKRPSVAVQSPNLSSGGGEDWLVPRAH